MQAVSAQRTPARAALAAVIGHVVEYYDFAVYALLAPVLSGLFFPAGDPSASLLATFAVFGVAYIIRPLGGVVFGRLADRVGRRRTLSTVILLMSVATAAIGLLPTYSSLGLLAPLLLVTCRVLQGLSQGGEYSGSASFVTEHAPPGRRGFYTSWLLGSTGLGLTIGAVAGTVLTSAVSQSAIEQWAWRVPFLIAFPLGAIGLYLRLSLDESPEFTQAQTARTTADGTSGHPTLTQALGEHRRSIATLAGLVILLTTSVYVFFVYMTTYLHTVVGVPLRTALPASIAGFLTVFLATPLFGALSDRVGRRVVLAGGAAAHIVAVVPLFMLMQAGTPIAITAAYLGLGLVYASYAGPFTAAVAEQFPPEVRAVSLGVGYQLPVCLFGGLSSLTLTFLIDVTGRPIVPAIYVAVAAAVSLAAVLGLRSHSHRWQDGTHPRPSVHSGRGTPDAQVDHQ